MPCIPRIREAAEALRAALLAPPDESVEKLVRQAPAVQAAALELEAFARELKASGSDSPEVSVRAELEALARELRAAQRLIAQGLEMARGLARLLSPSSTYGQDGEPAPVKPPGTVLVRG